MAQETKLLKKNDERKLRDAVAEAIDCRKVDVICEESDPCRLSIAQKLAYEHAPPASFGKI